ncbi:MAG: DsbA family oxidoreductase [Burkholderiales bacterium]|nr:DsbA family oxidoreductase [Burkholderiales bacterium]
MGKRRLEAALKLYRERNPDAEEPTVRWLPFQLNPDIPAGGITRKDYVERKFGPGGKNKYERVAAVGKGEGIDFAFDKIEFQPNTVDVHRLIHHATLNGREDEINEALFKGFFVEGKNLSDQNTLVDIAVSVGLDRAVVAAYLAGDAGRDIIREADLEARNAGVQGVPFFIFNRKVGVSGAHEAESLLQAMQQALQDEPDEPA